MPRSDQKLVKGAWGYEMWVGVKKMVFRAKREMK